jgi:acyl-CoA thioesterase I
MSPTAGHSGNPPPHRQTILVTLFVAPAIAASLLVFPAHIPWMIAGWMACDTLLVLRGRTSHWPLLAGLSIAVVRGYFLSSGALGVLAAVLVVRIATFLISRRMPQDSPSKRVPFRSCAVLWLAVGLFAWDWHAATHSSTTIDLPPDATVVCIGDSLTAPEGRAGGYPEALAHLIPQRVVNLGQDGITTRDALAKLPQLIEARPRVVVIELGGHDFLKGRDRAEARANLRQIISAAQSTGAAVLLVEVPRGFIFDPWRGLERDLARELDLELVPDSVIRRFVLFSPFAPPGMWLPHDRLLSEDGLHPNAAGKQAFAATIAAAIRRISKS